MASPSCAGLLPIPRCSGQLDSVAHFPPTRLPAVAERPHPSQSTRPGALGSSLSSLDQVDSSTPHSASLSRCPLRRYPSPVRAVCAKALVRICAGGDQRWSSLPRHLAHSFHGWLLPCRQGFANICQEQPDPRLRSDSERKCPSRQDSTEANRGLAHGDYYRRTRTIASLHSRNCHPANLMSAVTTHNPTPFTVKTPCAAPSV